MQWNHGACPYASKDWTNPRTRESHGEDFNQGDYLEVYCSSQGNYCEFEDVNECGIYEKYKDE